MEQTPIVSSTERMPVDPDQGRGQKVGAISSLRVEKPTAVVGNSSAMIVDLAEKHISPEAANGIRQDQDRLQSLIKNDTLLVKRKKGEISDEDNKKMGELERKYGLNLNPLTLEEIQLLNDFMDNKGDAEKRKTAIISQLVGFAAHRSPNSVPFGTGHYPEHTLEKMNPVNLRRDFLPNIGRLEEKAAGCYEKHESGIDFESIIEDDQAGLKDAIENYIETYLIYNNEIRDDYGAKSGFVMSNEARRHFMRRMSKEDGFIEELLDSEVADEYRYVYGPYTRKDLDDLSQISTMIWDDTIRGARNSSMGQMIDEIIAPRLRGSNAEYNILRYYICESLMPNHLMSVKNTLLSAVAIAKEQIKERPYLEQQKDAKKVIKKYNNQLSEDEDSMLSSMDFRRQLGKAEEKVVREDVANNNMVIGVEDYYERIMSKIFNNVRGEGGHLGDGIEQFNSKNQNSFGEYLVARGINKNAVEMDKDIRYIKKYCARLLYINPTKIDEQELLDRIQEEATALTDSREKDIELAQVKDLAKLQKWINDYTNRCVFMQQLSERHKTSVENHNLLSDASMGSLGI